MNYFRMPTKICMGEGSIEELVNLEAKKVFILCDPFINSSGKIKVLINILDKKGISYKIFDKIIPDPTIDIVSKGLIEIENDTDVIIAIGGGSAIDTAKVVRKTYEIKNSKTTKFVAIPTTSGTGSELTSFAVVTDIEKGTKFPLVDYSMLPDLAILDSSLTISVPKSITADTGMDVLTHALEALASKNANDFTDAYASKAVDLVFKYLKRAVDNGEDKEAREHLHNASAMAGIAFNEASLGICHSLAHALGAKFHIPHGRSNAMLLPHVLEYNAYLYTINMEVLEKYAELSRSLGFGMYDNLASVKSLIRQIQTLLKNINIPMYLDDILDIEEYRCSIQEMANKALVDKCTITNPKKPTLNDLEKIYEKLIRKNHRYI